MRPDPRDLKAFVRMFTEVGVCVWCLAHLHGDLWVVSALLASYFGGNLLQAISARLTGRPIRIAGLLLPVGLALVAAAMGSGELPLLLAALVATGFMTGVDWDPAVPARRRRITKICAKLAGMIGAAVAVLGPIAFGAVAISAAVWLVALHLAGSTTARPVTAVAWRRVDTINVFHQGSYFAFVFVFWTAMPGLPTWAPALLFPIGWFGYWGLELVLSGEGQPYRRRALAGGHAVVSATLAGMTLTTMPVPLMFGWFATGLGGGTCYTMERAAGGKPGRLSDDIGAVFGVGSAALLLFCSPTPTAALILGSAYALVVAVLSLLDIRRPIEGGEAYADR